MDYKYIEQLLDRYWRCETSVEEETILRVFFSQSSIPSRLMPYKRFFSCEKKLQDVRLGSAFDEKVLAKVGDEGQVKARKVTWGNRLMPLYKAAASVAIVLTLGDAAQSSFLHSEVSGGNDYNYESYEDSYNDIETAYGQVADALQMVSQGLSRTVQKDSVGQAVADDGF